MLKSRNVRVELRPWRGIKARQAENALYGKGFRHQNFSGKEENNAYF